MTEDQRDDFLAMTGDEERQAFVESLHADERLAHYPPAIQDAIWAKTVVPGMDAAAVLISVGPPKQRDIDEQAKAETGNDVERWSYGSAGAGAMVVVLVNGVVTEVVGGARP